MNSIEQPAVGAPVEPSVRPDVERVMRAVWDLVRSGPNFDGRQHNVEAAVLAAVDRAEAAERERCAAILRAWGAAAWQPNDVRGAADQMLQEVLKA